MRIIVAAALTLPIAASVAFGAEANPTTGNVETARFVYEDGGIVELGGFRFPLLPEAADSVEICLGWADSLTIAALDFLRERSGRRVCR